MNGTLRAIEPGPHVTLQDAGRRGWRRFGVTRSGAMDLPALAAANPTASLNLVARPQRRPSAAGASWQSVNQGACEADTQGSDRVRHVAL
jgi:hypothetical protein